MSLILIVSILIRIVALGWSIRLLAHLRDWRMGFLSAMLALMALRQSLTLVDTATSLKISLTAQVTELPGLAVSVLAFLSVLFLERIITERRIIKRALEKSEDRLRQSQKMEAIGRLAGGVAHDFNNLLTAILGYSEMILSRRQTDRETREAAEEIQNAGSRAAELTRQLLAFGRKQKLQPEIVDVNEIVSGLEGMLRRLVGEQIDFEVRLDPDVGSVSADRTQLEQVIVNLVVNARDALQAGGVLQISSGETILDEPDLIDFPDGQAGPYVRLSVSDTGEGMDVATQEQIFEPFFTKKSETGGTGLGLATVFGIVRQSGGTVRVQSALGNGSTFDVLLPRVDSATAVESEAPVSPPREDATPRSRTVLIVEDDPAVLRIAQATIKSAGYATLTAASGEEGIEVARAHAGRIDLLLTDVVMHGMTGIELASRIAGEKPEMAVVYMSGYAEGRLSEVQSLPPGAHFLAKPFTSHRLLAIVRRATQPRRYSVDDPG